MRLDFRYGLDDATLCPQWFNPAYPHLGAIPRKDANPAWVAMWGNPQRSDFLQSDVVHIDGVGMLKDSSKGMVMLRRLKEDLLREVEALQKVLHVTQNLRSGPLSTCMSQMMHTWVRLTTSPGTFEEKVLETVEYQRAWLECRGAVNYLKKVQNMHRASSGIDVEPDRGFVGFFTDNLTVAQDYRSSGMRFWLVRPAHKVLAGGVKIEYVVNAPHLHDDVEMRPIKHYPLLFSGSAHDPRHYDVQHRFMRTRMFYFDYQGKRKEVEDRSLALGNIESTTRSLQELATFKPPDLKEPSGGIGPARAHGSRHASRAGAAPCKFSIFTTFGIVLIL